MTYKLRRRRSVWWCSSLCEPMHHGAVLLSLQLLGGQKPCSQCRCTRGF
ncbi:Uncharacterised protein [Vibrio cholerae]|nr:Uncharacterised protein [Vibrio cholerae]CSB83555.1 Uncharacterised protein [Vibrio cholerae]